MAQTPQNQGKSWSDEDVDSLRELASHNTPTPLIGSKLGRSADAVQAKAAEIGLSLKPVNRSPYGTTA